MRVMAVLVLLLGGWAAAQWCLPELRGETETEALAQLASGRDAARYVYRAVTLLEPLLPPLATASAPLEPNDPDYPVVRALAEYRLLPAGWRPDALSVAVWYEMLSRLAGWYDLAITPTVAKAPTRWQLLSDLALLIARVGPSLKPIALIAADERQRHQVAFWALIRNDSIYPRLIVVRPPDAAVSLQRGAAAVLPYLSSCATEVRRYVFAPAQTAQRLFLAHNEARMVVVALEPYTPDPLEYVPEGEELAYLTFEHAALDGYRRFAALFVGPGPSLPTVLRLLPQLRTNLGPREVIEFVLGP